MNTQWELYFLRREIERQKIQKQRKKKRRIWIAGISGLLALVFLAGGISMVRFYRSDYGKLKRAADQYDFRLAAVRMSQYVNKKYGEEVSSADSTGIVYCFASFTPAIRRTASECPWLTPFPQNV